MDIRWRCYSRIDTLNEEMLRKMAAAGCYSVFFGLVLSDRHAGIRYRVGKLIEVLYWLGVEPIGHAADETIKPRETKDPVLLSHLEPGIRPT